MKNRIIEICELGQPQSIIQRENEPISELIKTDSLIEDLNEQLLLHNVSQQRELFYNFITWYNAKPKVEKNKDGLVTIGVIDEFLKL